MADRIEYRNEDNQRSRVDIYAPHDESNLWMLSNFDGHLPNDENHVKISRDYSAHYHDNGRISSVYTSVYNHETGASDAWTMRFDERGEVTSISRSINGTFQDIPVTNASAAAHAMRMQLEEILDVTPEMHAEAMARGFQLPQPFKDLLVNPDERLVVDLPDGSEVTPAPCPPNPAKISVGAKIDF